MPTSDVLLLRTLLLVLARLVLLLLASSGPIWLLRDSKLCTCTVRVCA